ncbi:hypothetical protein HPB52_010200 [Rhipicephalus sanguineus]|uniref:Uncharacterized protein n=1 Tax=Rhipicephalus sanguineus TaxID=34632 RepID=A0A9D4PVL8_RHISA|nr:hypothetical protein HPB52_010200 [Rhipicephalus sanguineus]
MELITNLDARVGQLERPKVKAYANAAAESAVQGEINAKTLMLNVLKPTSKVLVDCAGDVIISYKANASLLRRRRGLNDDAKADLLDSCEFKAIIDTQVPVLAAAGRVDDHPEALPLTVISLFPTVAEALIGLPENRLPGEIDNQVDIMSMVGLLLLYVAVDLTPLWTRLSLWLLSWRGAPVKPLFAGLMTVAFTASFFLPAAFVTLVLAAFINRTMQNIEVSDIVLASYPNARFTLK